MKQSNRLEKKWLVFSPHFGLFFVGGEASNISGSIMCSSIRRLGAQFRSLYWTRPKITFWLICNYTSEAHFKNVKKDYGLMRNIWRKKHDSIWGVYWTNKILTNHLSFQLSSAQWQSLQVLSILILHQFT